MSLTEYRRKRDFERTTEPRGKQSRARTRQLTFVVQKHAARRLHYDFRLELDGVLKSWAVPKGPSLVAGERRMAVEVEDHPFEYGSFEGVIPKGEYGGGTVLLWDRGTWRPIGDPRAGLAGGKLDFELVGEKLRGRFHLIKTRSNWLLIKGRDSAARPAGSAIVEEAPLSVATDRSLEEIARDADRVWSSERAPEPPPLEGARRGKLPSRFEPQLATLVERPPEGDDWLHEIKLDGYRLLCRVERSGRRRSVRLTTRAGNDWTDRFPSIVAAAEKLPVGAALIDGEAVVLDADGRTSFQALQRALGNEPHGSPDEIVFFGFDLIHLDGQDLTGAPLEARKRSLRELLSGATDEALRYGDHVRGNGGEFFAAACRSRVEGIVSKRRDAPYRSGRAKTWLKIKCSQRQELVIVGFTEPSGSRVGFGALLLGAYDEQGKLRYAGKVGTGFDDRTLRELLKRLEPLERGKACIDDPPRTRGVHWVEPRLSAEIAFAEWTRDGRVRHASFQGLREDKPARQVRIERARPKGNVVAGVRLSTPDRVYYPDIGLTKRELAAYYEVMAERVVPALSERPLTLLRCPEGIAGSCFYQKHAAEGVPEAVARIEVSSGDEPYAMITDLRSLVSLVGLGVLEFHVWGARADRLDRPDIVVFDLDPDPSVPWARLRDTAGALRVLLEGLGLTAFLRTTGGKGLHVVVPILRRSSWEEVKEFSQSIAQALVRAAPDRVTAVMSKSRRRGKIFIDYLRNARESTAIGSYSARAREGAPVAIPIAWDELDDARQPIRIGVREAPARLDLPDPWSDFEASSKSLRSAAQRLAELGV